MYTLQSACSAPVTVRVKFHTVEVWVTIQAASVSVEVAIFELQLPLPQLQLQPPELQLPYWLSLPFFCSTGIALVSSTSSQH